MLVPLAYLIVKRVGPLKRAVTRRVSLRTLLAWHIYAGILGPILGLLHTGHKFVSPLGIALTAMMIVVVLSGFIGRYLLGRTGQTIREKREMLTDLELAYRQTAGELAAHPEQDRAAPTPGRVLDAAGGLARLGVRGGGRGGPAAPVAGLAVGRIDGRPGVRHQDP